MLSIINVSTNQNYVLLVQGIGLDGLEVQVCDGTSHRCWHHDGKITSDMKPQSRNKEDNHTYMATLHQALTSSTSTPSAESRFVFDFNSPDDRVLQLVIKERLNGTSTLSILFRSQFTLSENSTLSMFQSIRHIFQQQNELLVEYKQKTQICEDNIKNYVKEIEQLTEWKESKHNELVPKMCIVINSKKIEIQRLKDELERLQAQSSSRGMPASVLEEEPVATKTARGTKKTPAAKAKTSKTATSVDAIKSKARGRPKKVVPEAESEGEMEEEEEVEDKEEEEDNSADESVSAPVVKTKGYDVPKVTQSSASTSFLTQRPSSLELDSSNIMDFLSQKQPVSQTAVSSSSMASSRGIEKSSTKAKDTTKRSRLDSNSDEDVMPAKKISVTKITQSQATNDVKAPVIVPKPDLPKTSDPPATKKKKFLDDSDDEDESCLNYM